MRQASHRIGLSAALLLVTACGGGEPVEADAPPSIALATRSAAQQGPDGEEAAPAPARSAMFECLTRLARPRLVPTGRPAEAQAEDCLVGSYSGITPSRERCFLRVESVTGKAGLGREDLRVELRLPRSATRGPTALSFGPVSAEADQVGLQVVSRASARVDSLVLTAGDGEDRATGGLLEMTFQRSEGADVSVVHCEFDGR